MDTTEEYIEMCVMAEKIDEYRESWKPAVGDFVIVDRVGQVGIAPGNQCGYYIINEVNHENRRGRQDTYNLIRHKFPWHKASEMWKSQIFWLPRIDQLQEMVNCNIAAPGVLKSLAREYGHLWDKDLAYSWESFWLCVVMKEKYNKIWDGQDWKEES